MEELIKYLKTEGYFGFREVPGKGLCGLSHFMFTTGLAVGLEESGYKGRYCYRTQGEAEVALKYWDGQGDPLGNWIKYKGEGGERENSGK
jgi:hypothetical protein